MCHLANRLLRARAGPQVPELFPLPAAGFSPRRDSQVGLVPLPRVPRRHGAAEAWSSRASAARREVLGHEQDCWRTPLVAPGRDVRAARGLTGHLRSNPLVFLVGKPRHREGSQSGWQPLLLLPFLVTRLASHQTQAATSLTFPDRSSAEGHPPLVSPMVTGFISFVAFIPL